MHHDELDRPEWDRPRRSVPPARRVIICSTPRAGSYLLCRQMINARLGLPSEYFRERTLVQLASRWSVKPRDDDGYLAELEARRTTDNGVFAAKIQWHHLMEHRRTGERMLERADLIVLLYRNDLVAQAVSWQVSLATGYWSFDATPGPRAADVVLENTGQTLELAKDLLRQNRAWGELLAGLGRPLIRIAYESFVGQQSALLMRMAADLSLNAGAWSLPPPESHVSQLPPDVEAARDRLLSDTRAAVAAATGA